jgi:hypothetical protein
MKRASELLLAGGLVGLLVVALPACGGGASKVEPLVKPAESIDGFVNRLRAAMAAVQSGRCPEVTRFNANSSFKLFCDAKARRFYRRFKVVRKAAFGTGGVVDFTDTEAPRGGTYVVALNPARRFSIIFPLLLGRRSVGTRPRNLRAFDAAVAAYLAAIRSRNCDLYFNYSLTRPGVGKRQDCAEAFNPRSRIRPELAADRAAKPRRYGGTADFVFYGLSSKPNHYRTLVVVRDPITGNHLVTAVRVH